MHPVHVRSHSDADVVRLPILSEFDTFDAPSPSSNCQWKTWEPETSESSEAYIRLPAEDTSKRQETAERIYDMWYSSRKCF
jgi:hypothetical protein